MEPFTLVDENLRPRNKLAPTRLGFAVLMRFLMPKGCLPRGRAQEPIFAARDLRVRDLQEVLADDDWTAPSTGPDRRGLMQLLWRHVLPYGEIRLHMSRRLGLALSTSGGAHA